MHARPPLRWLAPACAAVLLAACATTAPKPAPPLAPVARPAPAPVACTTCGRIERIDAAPASAATRSRGAVLGGVVGGVLARPAPATATGAAKPTAPATRNYRIVVLLDSGRRLILTQPLSAGMKPGARVRVDRSRAVLLR